MKGRSKKSKAASLPVSGKSTFSPESAAGPTLSSLSVGQQTDLFGQAVVPVSRSRQRANGKAKPMKDTSGPKCEDSLPNAGRPQSWESKSPAGMVGNGSADSRECSGCRIRKPLSEFYKHKECGKGYRPTCKECCRKEERERKAKIPAEQRTESFRVWRKTNRARALMTLAKHRAKLKGLEYSLDGCAPSIQGVIDAGVCELTGIPFNLDGGKTWDSPSLDRINNAKGYSLENVRVVLYCVNVMANLWGENKIVEIADAIMESRRDHSANLQTHLESALKAQIDTQNSPEYEMIWRHSAMQSGAPICRLAASGRRTKGADCSGWPTPLLHDGRRPCGGKGSTNGTSLSRDAVLWLAGWNTPTTNDAKQAQAQAQAQAASRNLSGQVRESSPAEMGKRGALNPAFYLWLMGYPAEWASCGALAMQSCRKSRRSSSKRT